MANLTSHPTPGGGSGHQGPPSKSPPSGGGWTPPPINLPPPDKLQDLDGRIRNLESLGSGFSFGGVLASFMALPGLVGFWPMSSISRSTGNAFDLGGQGWTLTYNGNPAYTYYNGLIPYIDLDGTGDYLSRADAADLDITGAETIYTTGARGLTMGGWFWFDTFTVADGLMSKWGVTNVSGGYMLYVVSGNKVEFIGEDAAAALTFVDSVALSTGAWYFIVGRFVPSTSADIFVNGVKSTNTANNIADIRQNAIQFEIGNWSTGGSPMDGRASLCFLCANQLGDDLINSLYQSSRVLFQV